MMQTSLHLVAGLGKTGHSIGRYLKKRNRPFVAFDTRANPDGLDEFKAEFPGVDVFSGSLPDSIYSQLVGVISSPGVALDHPVMQKALQSGIPVYGDIECLAREIRAPVIAITGTNGKSTVTTLVGEMARAAGLTVAVAGNIGTPVLDLLDGSVNFDLWVLELSSFQLDLVSSLKPLAATILNVTPDHLDRHHDLQAYVNAKQRIYHQAGLLLCNRGDKQTVPDAKLVMTGSTLSSFGLDASDSDWGVIVEGGVSFLGCGHRKLLSVNDLKIKGRHNWENALASCALAEQAGVSWLVMADVLKKFTGLPHRCQWVRTLDQVDWIDDSKGTNIGATMSAISGIGGSMKGKIVLIAGGQGKGADFTDLRQSMKDFVRTVVLIGEDADKMERALVDSVRIIRAQSMDEAVSLARTESRSGDVVLLSPACASFDMFRDFNHRGEVFASVVNAL